MQQSLGKKGFTIIEGLIAAAVLAVNIVAVNEAMMQQKNAAANVHRIQNFNNFIAETANILGDSISCRNSLAGVSINSGQVNTIYRVDSAAVVTPFYNLNQGYGISHKIQIESLALSNFKPIDSATSGIATLFVKTRSSHRTISFNREIPIRAIINGSNQVVTCRTSLDSFFQASCAALGGVMSANQCINWNNPSNIIANNAVVQVQGSLQTNQMVAGSLSTALGLNAQDTIAGFAQVNTNLIVSSGTANMLSANRIVADQICIGGRCRRFQDATCPPGGFLVNGVNADGSVSCVPVPPPPPAIPPWAPAK